MSKYYKLVVLYGASGLYIGDNEDLKAWLETNSIPNVEFVFVKPSKLTLLGEFLNKKGFIYAHYPAIRRWQKDAYKTAMKLICSYEIDIVHHLGPIGYREPGYLWKIHKPYVWGPVGGFSMPDKCLLSFLSLFKRAKICFRSWTNKIQSHYDRRVQNAMRKADIVIAATKNTKKIIESLYGRRVEYAPENCMRSMANRRNNRFDNPETIRVIMAGRLDINKNNILLLMALKKMEHKECIRVDLVGDGSQRQRLERFSEDNGLSDIVTIHGMLPRDKVQELFDAAHLHVITSIAEANTTVMWEAMEHAVPTMTIDHCGMADVITENIGIRVPVDEIEKMAETIAKELDVLTQNPCRLKILSDGTLERSKKYQWDERCREFIRFYDLAEQNFNRR